ncbi:MAG: hypothetical protein HY922_10280 [Elusimicrobia bacterium]|nr:hypothetical protein [Elusimicrobiota bacterium]
MNFRLKNPLEMTPRERRQRIIELLAKASIRLAEEDGDRRPPPPTQKGLDVPEKSL